MRELRMWLIQKLVGDMPVVANVKVYGWMQISSKEASDVFPDESLGSICVTKPGGCLEPIPPPVIRGKGEGGMVFNCNFKERE